MEVDSVPQNWKCHTCTHYFTGQCLHRSIIRVSSRVKNEVYKYTNKIARDIDKLVPVIFNAKYADSWG